MTQSQPRLKTRVRRALTPAMLRGFGGLRRFAERWERWADSRELADRSVPLPAGAETTLHDGNPRLLELRAAYGALDWPVVTHSRWQPDSFEGWLDLRYFRGETAYLWHYRESEQITSLRYLAYMQYLERIDTAGLLDVLTEDGAFGCWSYDLPGRRRCSRDLLDSVSELLFLDRHLGILTADELRVLDVGAGYGRLAHRGATACKGLAEWCCVDAVAPSTFLCEYYLKYRNVAPPARVAALPDVPNLDGPFDLACNVHSFSECTVGAIAWWVDQLARLEVPTLFVVPNEPEGFLSLETDGRRLDYQNVIEHGGWRLTFDEPAIADPAVQAAFNIFDRYCLFTRA